MTTRVAIAVVSLLALHPVALAEDAHWGYDKGHGGPAHWSELSKEELAAFTKLYPGNARPLQPPNGRTVRASM